MTSVAEA